MASRVADDSAQPTDGNADGASTPASSKDMSKPANSKNPATKSARKKRPTVQSVQQELSALQSRLDHADDVTKRSVASLETVVSALEATLKKSTVAQKGRLTRHVNELTDRLDRQTRQMRDAVRAELRNAMNEGGLENVDAALGRAATRLDRAEVEQADAITRVNKHLADIARAVDARIKAESQARKEELDKVAAALGTDIDKARADMEQRVDAIERDSAQALGKVGDSIERIHEQLEQRRQASSDVVVEKVNELALQTQAELDAHQSRLEASFETRFEEVEARHIAVGTGTAERVIEKTRTEIDQTIDALKTRIGDLEHRTVEAVATARRAETKADALARSQTAPAAPAAPAAPKDKGSPVALAPLPPLPSEEATPSHNPVQALRDRITSNRGSSSSAAAAVAANPYAPALLPSNDVAPEAPAAFQPDNDPFASPVVPFPSNADTVGATDAPPLPPFQMPGEMSGGLTAPTASADDDFQPAPIPGAVFANPAYADGSASDSPMAVRVADDTPRRSLKLPAISGRNVRLLALCAGVAVVAILAGRMILGTSELTAPNVTGGGTGQPGGMTQPQNRVQPQPQPLIQPQPQTRIVNGQVPQTDSLAGVATAGQAFSDPAQPSQALPQGPANAPIGTYTDQQTAQVADAQLDTLDAAVDAGNPIAQFQKGLAELDAGNTDAGASLIRQSASANQPAALYRLAKLYEAGEGVPRDDVMARQLIERAARGGNRIAMHDLALYYTEGRGGVALDMEAAKSWFEQAARRGVVDSQFNLAILSESTETGADPDLEGALFWYSVAAKQGDQFAVSRRDALSGAVGDEARDRIQGEVDAFSPRPIERAANGIFDDLPWVRSTETASRTQIREAQTLLATLGYPVGTPDGLMGSRTRTAIQQFERANGLSETGEVNGRLLNRLTRAAGV